MKSTRKKEGRKAAQPRGSAMVAMIAIVLVAAAAATFLVTRPARLVLASLDQRETTAFTGFAKETGISMSPRTLDDKGLAAVLQGMGRSTVVAFRPDRGFGALEAGLGPLPRELSDTYPPFLLAHFSAGGSVRALPLLLDMWQISYSEPALRSLGLPAPSSLEDLEADCAGLNAAHHGDRVPFTPLVVAGGDDDTLLMAISGLVIAEGGAEAYSALITGIAEGGGFEAVLGRPLDGKGNTLAAALGRLVDWKQAGWLSRNWLDMKAMDIRTMFGNGLSAMFAVTLGEQRDFDIQSLDGVRSLPFPRAKALRDPVFIGPMTVVAVSPKAGSAAKALLARLSGTGAVERLAATSGRAPALPGAQTADIQARTARDAAFGSVALFQGLRADAFANDRDAAAFAASAREWLREKGRR